MFLAATAAVEGKMSKSLKKVLKKIVAKDIHQELAVADAKLGGVIKVRNLFNDVQFFLSSFEWCFKKKWWYPCNSCNVTNVGAVVIFFK